MQAVDQIYNDCRQRRMVDEQLHDDVIHLDDLARAITINHPLNNGCRVHQDLAG